MRCIKCGKYPLCEFIEDPQREDCEKQVERPLEVEIHERKENENGYNEFGRNKSISK